MGVARGHEGRAPAVRRAAAVLNLLAFERRATQGEIVRSAGLAKSSASDLIGTLLEERLVARSGDALVLGTAFVEIAAGFAGDVTVVRRFGPGWERSPLLREHTVSLQALVGTRSVCVCVRLGAHVLPYTPRAGNRLPFAAECGWEPVTRTVPRDDLLRTITRFPEHGSPMEERERFDALLGRSDAAEEPAIASTGNLEVNALVSTGAERGAPVVATLHLPPSYAGDLFALRAALEGLAGDLRAGDAVERRRIAHHQRRLAAEGMTEHDRDE